MVVETDRRDSEAPNRDDVGSQCSVSLDRSFLVGTRFLFFVVLLLLLLIVEWLGRQSINVIQQSINPSNGSDSCNGAGGTPSIVRDSSSINQSINISRQIEQAIGHKVAAILSFVWFVDDKMMKKTTDILLAPTERQRRRPHRKESSSSLSLTHCTC